MNKGEKMKTVGAKPLEVQVRYLNSVKKLNIKFYKLFKQCKSENLIYNGEYKKLKKFYRGMMYGNFYYDTDVYSSQDTVEVPLLQRYQTKVWQYVCDNIYTTLKKWNKENIKAGKRPVQDTQEYKKKMMERALLSDIGTCGYCEAKQEIENSVMYDHGFTIGRGFRNGVCAGAGLKPYERSPEGKELLVKHIKSKIEFIKSEQPTAATVDFFNSDQFKYNQSDIDALQKESGWCYEKVGDWKTREFLESPIYNEATLKRLTKIFNNFLDYYVAWLSREEEKLSKWKAVPTYRELALAKQNKGGN